MGCTTSKLDDEDAVQLCKDRKKFIKQAVEYSHFFAARHLAYIQSLRRVSNALRTYVEGDEHREFPSPQFTTIKKGNPEIVAIPLKSLPSAAPIQLRPGSSRIVNYYTRASVNPSVSIEQRPQSPENVRIESYSPRHHYGMGGFYSTQSLYAASSFFSSSLHDRASVPPLSPQTSIWDQFWNPFSSLDFYGYPTRSSIDETTRLRQVREEEGIPDLEEEAEEDKGEEQEGFVQVESRHDRVDSDSCSCNEGVDVEVVSETDIETETEHGMKEFQSQTAESIEMSKAKNDVEIDFSKKQDVVSNEEGAEETPGFTVYVNKRPTSMAEVVKDIETQFTLVCDSAKEVSKLLESNRIQYSSVGHELTASKMLNPIALIRSASSRSASFRFRHASSTSKDFDYDSGSDMSEDSCMFNGSHQSTLDRLYAWEKKLYEEVKSEERTRIAYEKKCMQLRNQDVRGDDPFVVDKTRAAVRDLHTQIKVSLQTVESISKRIETLRDEELQPQLLELIQGLGRMWGVMAESHRKQKQTIDEAKRMLAKTPQRIQPISGSLDPFRLARAASNLELELRNWRACFESWVSSQRSYIQALASWALRCTRARPDLYSLPFSPLRSDGSPPILGICVHWSRFLDEIREGPVLDGLDFFAAGVGSVFGREEEGKKSKRFGVAVSADIEGKMALVEREDDETAEKTAELAVRVLCAGMSVTVCSLAEFAFCSLEGYQEMSRKWEENGKGREEERSRV